MLRDYIRQLSEQRFWLSKWLAAAIIFGVVLLAGLIFLITRTLDFESFLNYFSLGLLLFVFVTLFYGIIAIHDVPYEIAKGRNHPHQDAIHAAGWVSLFTLHALWPLLWIWAMLYRPERGWGFKDAPATEGSGPSDGIEELRQRVSALEQRLKGGVR